MIEHDEPTDLGAFHGDPEVKAFYLDRLQAHRAAGELVQGTYWRDGRGCAVGCIIRGSSHHVYAARLNIPEVVVRLQDSIFEWLPHAAAQEFPLRFLSALKPGADLTGVTSRLLAWILADPDYGLARLTTTAQGLEAVTSVAALHARRVTGDEPTAAEWTAAQVFVGEVGTYKASRLETIIIAAAYYASYVSGYSDTSAALDTAAAHAVSQEDEELYVTGIVDELIRLLAAAPQVAAGELP